MITSLIDKFDNMELIRDKIASILTNEIANQKALAIAANKNSNLWNFKVYIERSNPIENFLNINEDATLADNLPIVNVWFDNYNLEDKSSNTVEKQTINGTFNIDIYALGIAKNNPLSGHLMGDELANRETQRVFRLVRNILMSSNYTYLEMQKTVGRRWIQSVTSFQPESDGKVIQQIQAIRIAFTVQFIEFSPQYQGQSLELISNELKRNEDGSVIANVDFTYPIEN